MITLSIIMSIMIAIMVYSVGKMVILDVIDIICFNPGHITFKDNNNDDPYNPRMNTWELTECERKRYSGHLPINPGGRFDTVLPECHHDSAHNLTMNYESKMNESTTNAFVLGQLVTKHKWIAYKAMKNNINSWKKREIDDDGSPFHEV